MNGTLLRTILAALLTGAAAAATTVDLSSVTAPAGAPIAIAAQSSTAGALTTCVLHIAYPPEKLTFLSAKPGAAAATKTLTAHAENGMLSIALLGGAQPFTDGTLATLIFEINPAATPGEILPLTGATSSGADATAAPADLTISNAQATVSPPAATHSADTNKNWRIALQELLRVIQFYNSNGYHCEAGTEDGYGPGPGDVSCGYHNSDFNPADGKIFLTEVLRLIQFFNMGAYHPDAAQSDAFAPGYFQ